MSGDTSRFYQKRSTATHHDSDTSKFYRKRSATATHQSSTERSTATHQSSTERSTATHQSSTENGRQRHIKVLPKTIDSDTSRFYQKRSTATHHSTATLKFVRQRHIKAPSKTFALPKTDDSDTLIFRKSPTATHKVRTETRSYFLLNSPNSDT